MMIRKGDFMYIECILGVHWCIKDYDQWPTWCDSMWLIIEENLPNEYQVLNVLKIKTCYQLIYGKLIKKGFQDLKYGSRCEWSILVIQSWKNLNSSSNTSYPSILGLEPGFVKISKLVYHCFPN